MDRKIWINGSYVNWEDAQVHISVAFLIKSMLAVAVVTGSWYQAQMKFAEQQSKPCHFFV